MVPEAEVSSVVEVRLAPRKKEQVAHHKRDHHETMAEEEKPPRGMAEVTVEVEALPTVAINATSWDTII